MILVGEVLLERHFYWAIGFANVGWPLLFLTALIPHREKAGIRATSKGTGFLFTSGQ